VAARDAIDLSPLVRATPAKAILQPVAGGATTLTGTTDHTMREYSTQSERDSRPARFEKAANKPPMFPWLTWPNQPFGSVVDLALVPVASPFDLPGRHSTDTPGSPSPKFFHLPRFFETTAPEAPWADLAGRGSGGKTSLFDFVHIPSPFAAIYTSIEPTPANTAALATLGLDLFPINQVSNFREPGRVNVNTITDRRVWRGLFGAVNALGVNGNADNPNDPVAPVGEADARDRLPGWNVDLFSRVASGSAQPAPPPGQTDDQDDDGVRPTRVAGLTQFFRALPDPGTVGPRTRPAAGGFVDRFVNEDANANLTLDAGEDTNVNGMLDFNHYRDTNLHAYFRYQTMRWLSNVTTTRSHVYGVWITIRYMDSPSTTANEVQPLSRNRAFYMFDRSIPVAYEKGKDHNVRDAILLRRIIQ